MKTKKVSRRDFLRMGSFAAVAAALAACQPQVIERTVEVEIEKTVEVPVEVEVEKVVTASPAPLDREPVTLDVWIERGDPQRTVCGTFIDTYNKELDDAGIPVKVEYDFPGEGFDELLAAAAAEGKSAMADALFGSSGEGMYPPYILAGFIPEHNTWMDAVGLDWSDYAPGVRKQIDGKDYWLPWGVAAFIQYINLDHAEEAGLDVSAEPPSDLETMIQWAEAMTKQSTDGRVERSGFLLTGSGGHPSLVWGTVLECLGGQIVGDDGKTPNFNNAVGKEAAQFVLDCFDDYVVSSRDVADRYKDWAVGNSSIFWTGTWVLATSLDAGLNFTTLPLPEIDGVRVSTDAATEAMNMFDTGDADRMMETARLLKWFTERMGEYCTIVGDICPTISGRAMTSYQNRPAAAYEGPALAAYAEGYAKGAIFHPEENLNYYWGDPLVENLDRVWLGDWTVEEGLDRLEAEVTEILNKNPVIDVKLV